MVGVPRNWIDHVNHEGDAWCKVDWEPLTDKTLHWNWNRNTHLLSELKLHTSQVRENKLNELLNK